MLVGVMPAARAAHRRLFLDSRCTASQPRFSHLGRAKFARRLPASLSELADPKHGPAHLPLHLAWSGLTTFDLDQPRCG